MLAARCHTDNTGNGLIIVVPNQNRSIDTLSGHTAIAQLPGAAGTPCESVRGITLAIV